MGAGCPWGEGSGGQHSSLRASRRKGSVSSPPSSDTSDDPASLAGESEAGGSGLSFQFVKQEWPWLRKEGGRPGGARWKYRRFA